MKLHDPAEAAVAGIDRDAFLIFFGEEESYHLIKLHDDGTDEFISGLKRTALLHAIQNNRDIMKEAAAIQLSPAELSAIVTAAPEHRRIQELESQVTDLSAKVKVFGPEIEDLRADNSAFAHCSDPQRSRKTN